jgi:pyruvate-ferredoxin/flavodoxin oxidoreductase
MDANEAVAGIAYRLNEVVGIYPITPASTMAESVDAWSAEGKKNLWGAVPSVVQMQSESGAIAAVHGALQAGSLSTTFTSSQGLLLMIPNLYKIAGEMNAAVFHVAARSVASHALSIFGDHSDVMAARATGLAMLCSSSVQEAQDFALIAQAATLESRLPFIHFFDGFRTSHEIGTVAVLSDEVLSGMIDESWIRRHRSRALNPDHPVLRGTAQNPDVFFQGREAANPYYAAVPGIVEKAFARFAELTGRSYKLFEYHGAPDAERVIVLMGSGSEAVHETVDALTARGEKVGVLKVRLFRPFEVSRFLEALPKTVRSMAVLDRTKEPGSAGEPLYLDCVRAVWQDSSGAGKLPKTLKVVGGRYGLSSKEFTPGMVHSVFEHLKTPEPKNGFTIGIRDDVSGTSLDYDREFTVEPDDVFRAIFYGLGSDGTVGANKHTIKIVGEHGGRSVQAYFVYDSRKSGAVTVSHLRFSPRPIRSTYLIQKANFVACHQFPFLEQYDVLEAALPGAVFLLNSPYGPDEVWDHLPAQTQKSILDKRLRFHVIDAFQVARRAGLGGRINTVMQACFFSLSRVLPMEKAMEEMRKSVREAYGRKGADVVEMNLKSLDWALEYLREVKTEGRSVREEKAGEPRMAGAPGFVQDVLGRIISGRGDELPVSAFPPDGTYPTATTQWEKRGLATHVPVWNASICIQCNKCTVVCPHSCLRAQVFKPEGAAPAPESFKSVNAMERDWKGLKYSIQLSPEDCTGCTLCVEVCPAREKGAPDRKALRMETAEKPLVESEKRNWEYFMKLPQPERRDLKLDSLRQEQVLRPLFEFSSACAGCGETPYLKLISQLYGDRMLVANATGCSSIFGGNLPTTPWAKDAQGRGPAWSNSLFENNAEFGLGMRLSLDQKRTETEDLLKAAASEVGENLIGAILECPQRKEHEIHEQRERVEELKRKLSASGKKHARLLESADSLVRKSVWIVGGDGWAYDIGFGGLDHVLASGRDVNVLVLDTEVYSNTGGQMSKATPLGAVARFAAKGKRTGKKDLGLMAMTYGHVYVASVALGAKDEHTLRVLLEAEAYDGPSLVIAYSHCIAHGIHMKDALKSQKAAVDSGRWMLYRYHPDRALRGENPLVVDSAEPHLPLHEDLVLENRFRILSAERPKDAERLFEEAQEDIHLRWKLYKELAGQAAKVRAQETGPKGA